MRPRLILFSGLGVDERLLEWQRLINADVEVPIWLNPLPGETMATYGRRMADEIRVDARPLFVGGVSFGGMVAQEAARYLPAIGLVLIATCRSNKGLPLPYRWACWLAGRMPLWAINLLKPVIPHVRVLMGFRRNGLVRWFADMIADTDANFLRWCLSAIATWPGAGATHLPFVHIQGDADLVIPTAWNRPTHLIAHGGHVCNVTHAAGVNAIVGSFVAKVTADNASRQSD